MKLATRFLRIVCFVMLGLGFASGPVSAGAFPGGPWVEEIPTVPEGTAAIYDPVRDRMLLVGGNGVWAFGLAPPCDWSPVTTFGTPPPSVIHQGAVYDPPRDRILVFWVGGAAGTEFVKVWELSLASMTWLVLSPSGSAPVNWWHPSVTYDPVRQRVLVIGGYNGHNYTSEVWSLSVAGAPAWSQLVPNGTAPPGRAFHVAVYDSLRDRVVVHGGLNNPNSWGLPDLWELRLSGSPTWAAITPSPALPSGLAIHTGVYDTKRDRLLIFGGINGDPPNAGLWAFVPEPAPAWESLSPLGEIAGRSWHTAVLDPVRDAMVVFGGREPVTFPYYHDVVALRLKDPAEWVGLSPLPASRTGAAVALDVPNRRLFVFGGYVGDYSYLDESYLDDLWMYDLGGARHWSRIATGTGPSARTQARLIYDHPRERLVLFGGFDGTQSLGDTWTLSLDNPTWTKVPGDGPAPRNGHTLVVDPVHARAIAFGGGSTVGCCGATLLDDAWSLSLDGTPAWSPISPQGTRPAPRMYHAAAYLAAQDRLIVHGGVAADSMRDDLWELRLGADPGWFELAPAGDETPGMANGRYGHSLALDPGAGRMLMFGGADSVGAYSDLWQLELGAAPGWARLEITGTPPEPRAFAGFDYDELAGQVVVFGAAGAGNDVWLAQVGEPVPVATSLAEASVNGRVARLVWYFGGVPPAGLRVERRTLDTGWTEIGAPVVDGTGRAGFEDHDLEPGTRYGYRLTHDGPGRVEHGPEVWVDVPLEATFGLAGAIPNPASTSRLMVSFSLPSGEPARLELFDLAGRRVTSRAVEALGAGTHVVRLGPGGALAPGVYWLSLTQGTRGARSRVVVFE